MDAKTKLHTAARRYCEDRFAQWVTAYEHLRAKDETRKEDMFQQGWDYSQEAYGIFQRYRLHKAIRIEVERLSPESSRDVEEMRSLLLCASDVAETRLDAELKNSAARAALREESEDYKTYVRILRESDLENLEPLPFRRVLSHQESVELWAKVRAKWDVRESYWFPLRADPTPDNVLPFHLDYFTSMGGFGFLKEAVIDRGISRIFELHEFGPDSPDCEIEVSIFEPAYCDGGEQYCTSAVADWLVYSSHESSITIAGDWLTEVFKANWPECENRTYLGPYSTEDLRGTWKWER